MTDPAGPQDRRVDAGDLPYDVCIETFNLTDSESPLAIEGGPGTPSITTA